MFRLRGVILVIRFLFVPIRPKFRNPEKLSFFYKFDYVLSILSDKRIVNDYNSQYFMILNIIYWLFYTINPLNGKKYIILIIV